MWTETAQQQHRRDRLRYASDVTDEEWAVIEGFLPRPRKLGRPRTTEMREVVNALLYMLTTGCQWRLLPKEFPPFSTVQRFFYRWRDGELWQKINHSLVLHAREASGREASPTAGIIDSQSRPPRPPVLAVTTPARKSRAVKRHVLTDTNGLLVAAVVHEADTQDRDGAPLVLAKVRYLHRWLRHVFADGAYSGTKLDTTLDKIGPMDHRDRQAFRYRPRLCRLAAALGCRVHSRLAQSQPTACQGL